MPIFKLTTDLFSCRYGIMIMNYETKMSNVSSEQDKIDNDDEFNSDEQAKRNCLARKRIDDLLEKKRLKELLDDEDDWEV